MSSSFKLATVAALITLSAAGAMAQKAGNAPLNAPGAPMAASESSGAAMNNGSSGQVGSTQRPDAVNANAQMSPKPMTSSSKSMKKRSAAKSDSSKASKKMGTKKRPDAVNANAQTSPEPVMAGSPVVVNEGSKNAKDAAIKSNAQTSLKPAPMADGKKPVSDPETKAVRAAPDSAVKGNAQTAPKPQ